MSNWREKLKASAHGEVTREGIDPYRAAGGSVYNYILELDELRVDATRPNVQAALLAGWVAFALQVLGDELLDADAAADPSTAHYVPRVTAEQAMAFYGPVQAWMSRARAAQASSAYQLDVPVPEVMPHWVEVEPCPYTHLLAFRQAANRLREHTQTVMADFDPQGRYGHARDVIAEAIAEADAAADYANGLWAATSGPPPANLHQTVEAHLKHSVESYFYIGQVIAMPALADAPRQVRPAQSDGRPPSFLETMINSYPQIAQRRRGGFLSGVGGGLLGGIIGGAVIDDILGGGGGWGDDDGFF